MSDSITEQQGSQQLNPIVESLLSGQVKTESLINSGQINQVLNTASDKLISKLGKETVEGIRVLLAASITPTDSDLVAKELLKGTSIQPESLDQDKAKDIINTASTNIARSVGVETEALRILVGTSLLGKGNPEVIKNLLGSSGVKSNSLNETSALRYISGTSSKLTERKLGPQGTKDLRVLIGVALSASKL